MFEKKLLDIGLWKTYIKTTLPVVIISFLGAYVVSNWKEKSALDYPLIKGAWERRDLKSVGALMRKHPELKKEYGGKIAQEHLLDGKVRLAKKMAGRGMTPFDLYAKSSLLIASGKYVQALKETKALQQELDTSSKLYGHTLVRAAMLCKELGDREQERAYYKEIERSELLSYLEAHYLSCNISLREYLSAKR